jgi:TolB-like protein
VNLDEDTILRFGVLELHLDSRLLAVGGRTTRLQEQPFAILRMLLERRGRVVTRDELRDVLWPAGTFVDFEHSLNAAIKRLRAALGDDADDPRFIETVPRRGYRFIADLEGRDPLDEHPRIRLAVLPFADLTGGPENALFSRGFTEEMISELGRRAAGALGVISSHSSMAFRNTTAGARTIGNLLRADYLLEGTLTRAGGQVRVTARLVESRSETQLWVETHAHAESDWQVAQVAIASRIAESLTLELVPPTPSAAPANHASEAYDAYLKGRYHWHRVADTGADEALRFFRDAVRLDPGLAQAHAGLALVCTMRAWYYRDVPRQALERAQDAAARALRLDPTLAEAHVADGDVKRLLWWDGRGARAAYERAIALNPSFETARGALARLLLAAGRISEAIREADAARELDLRCLTANTVAAWARYVGGDLEACIALCRHSLEMDETHVWAKLTLASALLAAGGQKEALRLLRDTARATPGPVVLAHLAYAEASTGDASRAREIVAEIERVSPTGYVSPYYLALARTGLGDRDEAFAQLARGAEERDPALLNLAVDPRFDPLRTDSRYVELSSAVGADAIEPCR